MAALLPLLVTFVLCAVALAIHTRVRGFLPEDAPAPGRKRHARPTPMLGAAPAAVAACHSALHGQPWLAAGLAAASLTGLADDLLKDRGEDGIRARTKALGQLLATVLALLGAGAALDTPPLTLVLAAALVFVVTNAVNFLDNQNGVATALGVVGLGFTATTPFDPAAPQTALAAAWLGFLPFNWPRARAFLGDQGALALGLCVGSQALRADLGPLHAGQLLWLAPCAIPLLDFTQVVAARLYLGYAPWIGDRRHLTHVLLVAGLPAALLAPLFAVLAAAAAWGLTVLVHHLG